MTRSGLSSSSCAGRVRVTAERCSPTLGRDSAVVDDVELTGRVDSLDDIARRAEHVAADLRAVQRRREAAHQDGWDISAFEHEERRLREELAELCQILALS